MKARRILSGAAALAVLASACSCEQDADSQSGSDMHQSSCTSGIDSAVTTSAYTEMHQSSYTSSIDSAVTTSAHTEMTKNTQPAVTTGVPQDASCSTRYPDAGSTSILDREQESQQTIAVMEPDNAGAEDPVSPLDWRQALNAEYQTYGGVTSLKSLGMTTYRGTAYGFQKRAISEDTYEYIYFSVDPDNQGKILDRWTDIRPQGAIYAFYKMYFCNGRFYLHAKHRYQDYASAEHVLEIYDTSGTCLKTYTLPQFWSSYSVPSENVTLLSDDFITVCGNGSILTREYKTHNAYDREYSYYLIDPYSGSKTLLPPPKDGAYGPFPYNQPLQPLRVTGVYQNKLYIICTNEYDEKDEFWFDLDAMEWHALPGGIQLDSPSNYSIGRYLFTQGQIYDMETDQFLPDVPEGATADDPNELLDPARSFTVNDTGVYVHMDNDIDPSGTPVLLWD